MSVESTSGMAGCVPMDHSHFVPPYDFQGCQGTLKDCFRPEVAEKSRALCQVQVCIF